MLPTNVTESVTNCQQQQMKYNTVNCLHTDTRVSWKVYKKSNKTV